MEQCKEEVYFIVNVVRYNVPVTTDIPAHHVYVIYSVPYEQPNNIQAESLAPYGNI